jgi:hypothetical protein
MIASVAICLMAATGCGSVSVAMVPVSTPTATPAVTLPQLAAAYPTLAKRLDMVLCALATIAASGNSSTASLKSAARYAADTSNWVTNRLAQLPWPGRLQADSQVLIMAIARVEAELRLASNAKSRPAVMKHIHKAQQLIARIPLAATQLRRDLHVVSGGGCSE